MFSSHFPIPNSSHLPRHVRIHPLLYHGQPKFPLLHRPPDTRRLTGLHVRHAPEAVEAPKVSRQTTQPAERTLANAQCDARASLRGASVARRRRRLLAGEQDGRGAGVVRAGAHAHGDQFGAGERRGQSPVCRTLRQAVFD